MLVFLLHCHSLSRLEQRPCTHLHTRSIPLSTHCLSQAHSREPAAARTPRAQVNGQPIKAFVDSGAQSSIMSQDCARRCNLLHLLDKRFQGMAVGVGSGKIVGQIHQVPCCESAVHAARCLNLAAQSISKHIQGWALEPLVEAVWVAHCKYFVTAEHE